MWEKKLFLSLDIWVSWSLLLAAFEKALGLVTGWARVE
jgi:hypothetical protein